MVDNSGAPDLRCFRPAALQERAQRLVQQRGWGWPITPPSVDPDILAREQLRLGYSNDVAALAERTSLGDFFEHIFVPMFVEELHERLGEVLHHCVAVVTGRNSQHHGFTRVYPGEGAVVFIDGALLLMFNDVVGHAVTLVSAEIDGDRMKFVVRPPTEAMIRDVASLIWLFVQRKRPFVPEQLPQIGTTNPYGGEKSFGKLLWFGERFLVGHEFGHALRDLELVGEAPGIREHVRGSVDVPEEVEDGWVDELSADNCALGLVASTAATEYERPVAIASCLVAAEFLTVLDRVLSLPPQIPFPMTAAEVPAHLSSLGYPPAELRLHCLEGAAHKDGTALEIASVYRSALSAICSGLFEANNGRCIARITENDWCRRDRGSTGWFCDEHGSRH